MAQSGYTPILIYASGTTGNTPSASNLTSSTSGSELALNYFDGKLFYKDASGNVQVLASKAGNINVSSLSFGTTGLTPSTATTGAITVAGVLNAANGGTGEAGTLTGILYGNGTSSHTVATTAQVLSLIGTLPVSNGGTGQTTFTAGQVLYGNGTSGLSTSANMTFSGTALTLANDASISGLTVGKGGGTASQATALGTQALLNQTTGYNTAVGYQAGSGITSGIYNVAIGGETLSTAAGNYNVAIGRAALNVNTGAYNTAVGGLALQSNTTGSQNTAVGYKSLYTNTTGAPNTAVGYQSLLSNTTGYDNVAIGTNALVTNSTGNSNIAIGDYALQANTTASNNTAVGYQAGYTGTTASDNTYFGYSSGYSNSSGAYNTYIGKFAAYYMTGSKNTVIGRYDGTQGGLTLTSASNYIVLSDGDGNPRLSIPTGTATATVPNATGTVMVSGNMPAFSYYLSGSQTLSSATFTKINFDTKEFDTNNNFASNRFTPTVAGYYQLNANISPYVSQTTIILSFYKNGAQFKTPFYTLTNAAAAGSSALIYFNGSTDYVEVYGFFLAGQQVAPVSYYTYFQGVLVRAA